MTDNRQQSIAGGSEGPPPAPRRRWLWPVLLVSLALNLLFVGIVAGAWWRGFPALTAAQTANFERQLFAYANSLPRERRATVVGNLGERRAELRGQFKALREARQALPQTLVMEPFDARRMEAAMAAIDEQERTVRSMVRPAVLQIIERMTPEERRGFANWQRKHRGKGASKGPKAE